MAGETIDDLGNVNIIPSLPPTGEQGSTAATTQTGTQDTQSKSTQSASFVSPDAALPFLVYPMHFTAYDDDSISQGVSSIRESTLSFLQSMQQKQHEIGNKIMSDYVEYVRQQAELIHRMMTDPVYIAKMQAESALTLGQAQALAVQPLIFEQLQQAYQTRLNIADGVTNYVNQARADGSTIAVPLIATAFVLGGAAIGAYLTTPGVDEAVPLSPKDSAPFDGLFGQAMTSITPDMRAELGLLGTLMVSTAIYQAAAEKLAGAAQPSDVPPAEKTLDFAKTYAYNIMELVKSKSLEAFINNIILNRMHKAQDLSDERLAELTTIVKAMMVVSAIGLINKIELGHLSGIEFRDLINGLTTSLPDDDVRWLLIKLLFNPGATKPEERGLLDQLNPQERARLMAALMRYMDTNPSVEAMLNMGRLFTGVMAQMPQSQRLPSQKF